MKSISFETFIVLLFLAAIFVGIATVFVAHTMYRYWTQKKEAKYLYEHSVSLFGHRMSDNDFVSFIQTCGAYLLANFDNVLDLAVFLNRDDLRYRKYHDDFRKIEEAINNLPYIYCHHVGDGKYVVDETETARKYAIHAERTQTDNYIYPMFQMDVIARNEELFSFVSKWHGTEVAKAILSGHEVKKDKMVLAESYNSWIEKHPKSSWFHKFERIVYEGSAYINSENKDLIVRSE